jgi:hypothetical protein
VVYQGAVNLDGLNLNVIVRRRLSDIPLRGLNDSLISKDFAPLKGYPDKVVS